MKFICVNTREDLRGNPNEQSASEGMFRTWRLNSLNALILRWLLIGIGGILILSAAGCPKPVVKTEPEKIADRAEPGAKPKGEDGPNLRKMEIAIVADPENETLHVKARLFLDNMKEGSYTGAIAKPKKFHRFVDEWTGDDVAYKFTPIPGVPDHISVTQLEFTVLSGESSRVLFLEYEYDRDSFKGHAPNPTTLDNLHLGQIQKEFIFSSHLYYYPHVFQGARKAEISIAVPKGWKGVSSGSLKSVTRDEDEKTVFNYFADFNSGRLPYPLAVYPYEKIEFKFDDRVPITIYFAETDRAYAEQRKELMRDKILPFLENLMGPYPFEELKVVEVFPWEGNTGLAARGLIMLSQKVWFAAHIGEDMSAMPVIVLVDEIAHQWNFYRIRLPNFLAEGVSQYTDELFVEHFEGRKVLEKKIEGYKKAYVGMVTLIEKLHKLHSEGLSMQEAAKRLNISGDQVAPLWSYAKRGNVPVTDPGVFPPLYFHKGVLALHGLREKIGDENFFKAFKSLFSAKSSDAEWTLDAFRIHFENETGKDLKSFFTKWYESVKLPE